jgi:signal transduction histidine kinase
VRGDAARLGDVLMSLVDNAIKYSPAGGEVVVRVERRWGQARLSVSDSGVGIGAADVPFLFTRFGRIVTPENSHIFGSGLGLYLVRELVRLHGGQVRARSKVGRGSTFSVELPLRVPLWRRLLPVRRPVRPASEAAG